MALSDNEAFGLLRVKKMQPDVLRALVPTLTAAEAIVVEMQEKSDSALAERLRAWAASKGRAAEAVQASRARLAPELAPIAAVAASSRHRQEVAAAWQEMVAAREEAAARPTHVSKRLADSCSWKEVEWQERAG